MNCITRLIPVFLAINTVFCFCAYSKEEVKRKESNQVIDHKNVNAIDKSKKLQINVARPKLLVPPPPASQPSFLLAPTTGTAPWPLNFMNNQAVFFSPADLQKQLAEARVQLNEKIQQMKEKKDKYERFGSLYQEGVISRHELEDAQKEAQEAEAETGRFKANVAFLEEESKTLAPKPKSSKKITASVKKTINESKSK